MKNSILIAFLIIVFLIMEYAQAPYVSCQEQTAGNISSTTKVDPKEQLAQAKNLVIKKEYQKAKEILNQILELEKDKPPRPYISGNMLYMYVHNQAEIIAFSGVHTLQDKKQRAEAMGKIWPEVLELEKTETWGNIIFDLPVAPEACQLLAYIDIDEQNIEEAFKHLDQAVRLWSRFLPAHGEYVFILVL